MLILVSFCVRGGIKIFAQRGSKKDELWKQSGLWSPGLLEGRIKEAFVYWCFNLIDTLTCNVESINDWSPIVWIKTAFWIQIISVKTKRKIHVFIRETTQTTKKEYVLIRFNFNRKYPKSPLISSVFSYMNLQETEVKGKEAAAADVFSWLSHKGA